MEELTKAEERVMQVLWQLKKGFIKDIIEHLPNTPKPPYNTISSVVRILEKKGYVGYTPYGKTYEYFPLIRKGEYKAFCVKKLLSDYFNNSAVNLVSFIIKEEKIKTDEAKKLKKILNKSV